MASRQDFHLQPDRIPSGGNSTTAATVPHKPPLVVPEGVSYLALDDAGELLLAVETPAERATEQFVLEPIWTGQHPQLLLLCPRDEQVLVNGRSATHLSVLSDGDQFQPDDQRVLHVRLFNRPEIGPPRRASVGVECPVCRSSIELDARVYTCLNCGTAMHLDGDEISLDLRRECAIALRECICCGAKVDMMEGYVSEPPELYCG